MTVGVFMRPAELPGMDAHLNHISLSCHHEVRCMLIPSPPQPHASWCVNKPSCYFRNLQPVNKVFGVKSSWIWDRIWQLREPRISMHKCWWMQLNKNNSAWYCLHRIHCKTINHFTVIKLISRYKLTSTKVFESLFLISLPTSAQEMQAVSGLQFKGRAIFKQCSQEEFKIIIFY